MQTGKLDGLATGKYMFCMSVRQMPVSIIWIKGKGLALQCFCDSKMQNINNYMQYNWQHTNLAALMVQSIKQYEHKNYPQT